MGFPPSPRIIACPYKHKPIKNSDMIITSGGKVAKRGGEVGGGKKGRGSGKGTIREV